MTNSKYYYIYNIDQSNFLINNGATVLSVGLGRDGDFYVLFPKSQKTNEIMTRWKKICDELK